MLLSIKEWRILKNITIETMSKELGVHPNTYTRWEKSPEDISIKNARIISKVLNVSMDDIIFCSNTLQNVE